MLKILQNCLGTCSPKPNRIQKKPATLLQISRCLPKDLHLRYHTHFCTNTFFKLGLPKESLLLPNDNAEMQKAASVASVLVLFFPPAVLIFGLCTAVLTFGQCIHKIGIASVDGTVVFCMISIDVLIFGVSNEHNLWPVDKCFIHYMCMCEITK